MTHPLIQEFQMPAHAPGKGAFIVAKLVLFILVVACLLTITGALAADHLDDKQKLAGYIHEQFDISPTKAHVIVNEAVFQANSHSMEPELILAVIAVESTFRAEVISDGGARGLMQVIPRWHPEKMEKIGGKDGLFNPAKNISTGVLILREYLARSKGNVRNALLRYNGSLSNPASSYADKVMREYRRIREVARLS